jgi:hypothetical protein
VSNIDTAVIIIDNEPLGGVRTMNMGDSKPSAKTRLEELEALYRRVADEEKALKKLYAVVFRVIFGEPVTFRSGVSCLEIAMEFDGTLATLSTRQERVVKWRFGLGDTGEVRTLEKIGQGFGLTGERIRQIEADALRKLRHPSRSDRIKPFIEGELKYV